MLRLLCSFALLMGATAHAESTAWPWEIKSVQLREIQDPSAKPLDVTKDCGTHSSPADPFVDDVSWDEIVRIGQQVWKIIEDNKPVLEISTPVVHALPRGLNCWSDLENWQAPVTRSYEIVYLNGWDMEVVKFRFRLHYTYGGGKEGRGRYLANVTVMPGELSVVMGYKFNARVEVGQTVNLGSVADPLAGIELNLRWNVQTLVKESENSYHFFVQGDGEAKSAE